MTMKISCSQFGFLDDDENISQSILIILMTMKMRKMKMTNAFDYHGCPSQATLNKRKLLPTQRCSYGRQRTYPQETHQCKSKDTSHEEAFASPVHLVTPIHLYRSFVLRWCLWSPAFSLHNLDKDLSWLPINNILVSR